MFKLIKSINDLMPAVAEKREIRFVMQPNGITIGCYAFSDSKTFDSPEALECRGVAFDSNGLIVSRPLHKFFNVGEKEWLAPERLLERNDIVAIYDKLDGSMIATAWFENRLFWRSKRAFHSDVVRLAEELLTAESNHSIVEFATEIARNGMTAIFELTHPEARIVVAQDRARLRLLHVRDNYTGKYLLLDPAHEIHQLIKKFHIPTVERFDNIELEDILKSLETMQNREGYVIQFANGDMAKVKCPWYLRLHRSISFLRERDIATLALNEELDDVKQSLVEAGVDLGEVEAVESKVKYILTNILDKVEEIYLRDKELDRKSFAIKNKEHQYFSLAIQRYTGDEVRLKEWYLRNRLKQDFGLRVLANETLSEAIGG